MPQLQNSLLTLLPWRVPFGAMETNLYIKVAVELIQVGEGAVFQLKVALGPLG